MFSRHPRPAHHAHPPHHGEMDRNHPPHHEEKRFTMFSRHPGPPRDAHPSHHGEMNRWHPPLPTAIDEELLVMILDDKDLARSVHRILINCPPEVAVTACIGLRLGGQIEELHREIEELKSIVTNNMSAKVMDNNES